MCYAGLVQEVHTDKHAMDGDVHLLRRGGIAHWDIKAANILLREEDADPEDVVNLVLTEFNGSTTAES